MIRLHWLPNTLTLANLCCGGLAIFWTMSDRPELSLIAVGLSLVFDLLDGMIARWLDVHHRLGAQLDSLADMVSFGISPSLVLMHYLGDLGLQEPWTYLPLLFAACAAVRLARFNVETRSGEHFYGLPSPAAALFVFGLYGAGTLNDGCSVCQAPFFVNPMLVLGISLSVGALMITDLKHFHFKNFRSEDGLKPVRILYLITIPCFFILLGKAAIASLVVVYILLSLAYFQMKKP